jgi:hypothetical protein
LPTQKVLVVVGNQNTNGILAERPTPVGIAVTQNTGSGTLSGVNLNTNAVTSVGSAYAFQNLVYSPATDTFVGFDTNSFSNIVQINPVTLATVSTTDITVLGYLPQGNLNLNPGNNFIYCAAQDLNTGNSVLLVYNPSTNAVAGVWDSGSNTPAIGSFFSFDVANKAMYTSYQTNNASPVQLAVWDVSAASPVFGNSFAMPTGGAGNQINQTIYCPDNKLVYCLYADNPTIGPFLITRFDTVALAFKQTENTTGPNNSDTAAAYNPVSKLLFLPLGLPGGAPSLNVYCPTGHTNPNPQPPSVDTFVGNISILNLNGLCYLTSKHFIGVMGINNPTDFAEYG